MASQTEEWVIILCVCRSPLLYINVREFDNLFREVVVELLKGSSSTKVATL